jgi:HK97 gp10 family phage protein
MAGFSLDISGIKQVEDAIKKIDAKATSGLSKELTDASTNIERVAKRTAPGNFGKLRGSINKDISNQLFKSVFSTVEYAPYVEFGTRGKARIPAGYEAFAAQYKAKGKSGKGLWSAIQFWIKRKGIDPKYTFPIFRAILNNGVPAQPFMIPAYEKEKPALLKRLKALFS